MNNTRNQTGINRNVRPAVSRCDEPMQTYNNAGCGCYPKMDTTKEMVIAMAYVPWQHFGSVCEPDKALQMGTIFPELYKPITGCKGGRC